MFPSDLPTIHHASSSSSSSSSSSCSSSSSSSSSSIFAPCPSCQQHFHESTRPPLVLRKNGQTICAQCAATRSKPDERFPTTVELLETLAAADRACKAARHPETQASQQQKTQASKQVCDGCQERPAEFRCAEDQAYLCSDCWPKAHPLAFQKKHQKITLTRDHCWRHPGVLLDRYCAAAQCSLRGDLMCQHCEEPSAHGHAGQVLGSGVEVFAHERRKMMRSALTALRSSVTAKLALISAAYVVMHDAESLLGIPDDKDFLSAAQQQCFEQLSAVHQQLDREEAGQEAERRANKERREAEKRACLERHPLNMENPWYKQVLEATGELKLNSKGITAADCPFIADALKINSTLTGLNLSFNRIGDEGCTAIADALKINSILITMHLSGNQIGEAGCTTIADALKINSTLITMHLSGNRIGDAGCTAIADALKINSTLTTLSLHTHNQIGDVGCTAIADALKINSTLKTLHLCSNQVGDAGCTAIADALKINSTLTELQLWGNQVGDAAKKVLRTVWGSRSSNLHA